MKYQNEVKALRAKQNEARKKLEEPGEAPRAAWKDLKSGGETAWGDLGKAVRNAADRFG